jgi:hypothetical protein
MSTVESTAASLEHGEYMEYYKNITRYHRVSKIHQRPEKAKLALFSLPCPRCCRHDHFFHLHPQA